MKKTLLPIQILVIFLSFLTLWSVTVWNGSNIESWYLSLLHLVMLFSGGAITRVLIRKLFKTEFSARVENRAVTVLILFLLFDSLVPWWIFLLLGVVTELTQYLFRTQQGPLFNPAAMGALFVSVLGFLPSWWGVNPAPRFPLFGIDTSVIAWFTALGAGYVVYRYRKLAIAGSASLTFLVSYFLIAGSVAPYLLLEGTLLFFILVMVCEPKTSPILKKDQIIYGSLVGLLLSLGLYFHFLEASLIALIIANIFTGRRFVLEILLKNGSVKAF